jgi:hypothetical protein
MKNICLKLGILSFLLLGFHSLYSQDFEVKITKADSIIVPGGTCIIELSVSGGASPYTYMLFDKEPWKGGKILEKTSAIMEVSHSFTILSAGRYLVGVTDNKDQTKIFIIQIKVAGTALLIHIPDNIGNEKLM